MVRAARRRGHRAPGLPRPHELFADAVPVLPAVTFDEGLTLHVGDSEVEVWHPGWAHTPGDAFLYLPEERLAICGDLLFSGYHYNYEDAFIPGVREGVASGQDDDTLAAEVRARYPTHLLAVVISSAIARFRR